MQCLTCRHEITPGMEISVGSNSQSTSHCPYCLELLRGRSEADGEADGRNVSVKRFTLRRRIREQFVERLVKLSHDGQPLCPVCGHALSKSDQILILNTEYFRCGCCHHDLAYHAYQKEAYHEQRWLPVVYSLADLKGDDRCAGCRFLGAMAKACQQAFSWMPHASSKHSKLIVSVLARCDWSPPDEACRASCGAIDQYRKLAGEGLILL